MFHVEHLGIVSGHDKVKYACVEPLQRLSPVSLQSNPREIANDSFTKICVIVNVPHGTLYCVAIKCSTWNIRIYKTFHMEHQDLRYNKSFT